MAGHTIRIKGTDAVFEAKEGETMLDAALRAGVGVRYGCRRGKCATCKHLVVEGEYDNSEASAYALLDEEREEGLTLLCQSFALSDCTIDLAGSAESEDVRLPTPGTLEATVAEVSLVSGVVHRLVLDLDSPLRFLPGQYIELTVPERGPQRRAYSIASSPFKPRQVELLVEQRPDGALSSGIGTLSGERVTVAGPFGRMFLRTPERPVVLVGEGVGVAPFLSMLAYLSSRRWPTVVRLLHSAPDPAGLPCHQDLAAKAAQHAELAYAPLVRDGGEEHGWPNSDIGAGLVAHIDSGEEIDVYVSGAEGFCDRVQLTMEARGVDPARIFMEPFCAA